MTTNLKIRSLLPVGGANLSLEGSDKTTTKVNISPLQEVEVPVRYVQFDQAWLELLANYVTKQKVEVTLDGYVLSPDEIRELKHTDVNEVLGQWLESKERGIVPASLGHGRYYSGSDGHPHYRAGNGADYDLTMAGTYLEQITNRIYVDGGRTDVYVESGSILRPYKTIQAAVNACPPGGCLSIAAATYNENVTMVARISVDADPGTLLRAVAGDALTLTDDAAPGPAGVPMFIRGLFMQAENPAGWCIKVVSTGTWQPFAVLLDLGLNSRNGAGHIWCDGGGCYCTDAGGTDGDAAVSVRLGASGTTRGGFLITGRFNFNCGAGGKQIEAHENAFILADGAQFSANGPGATLFELNGLDTPMTGINVSMRYGNVIGGFDTVVRSTGQNVSVQIDNEYGSRWGDFSGIVFDMPEGGQLTLNDGQYSSSGAQVLRFGRNLPVPSNGQVQARNVNFITNGAVRSIEVSGNAGIELYECRGEAQNGGAPGVLQSALAGGVVMLSGGSYQGQGPVVELLQSAMFLLGGVDLVPTGGGPGGVPIASAVGTTLYRGHCNIRSGQPVIAGTEVLLTSNFGMLEVGPSVSRVRVGAGQALPVGGMGYERGSLFVLVPLPAGQPILYQNTGTEAAPVWVVGSYAAVVPGDWAGGLAPADVQAALDRIAAALNAHGIPA